MLVIKKIDIWLDSSTNYSWAIYTFPKNVNFEVANSDILDELGSDWKLPSIMEMITLFDYTRYDSVFRKECPFNTTELFWTSTEYSISDSVAWVVDSKDGQILPKSKKNVCTMVSIKK